MKINRKDMVQECQCCFICTNCSGRAGDYKCNSNPKLIMGNPCGCRCDDFVKKPECKDTYCKGCEELESWSEGWGYHPKVLIPLVSLWPKIRGCSRQQKKATDSTDSKDKINV